MLQLNNYPADKIAFFSLRDQAINGVSYDKGDYISPAVAQRYHNLETLVRSKRVVAVANDRRALPKMFLREIKSPHYVLVKYGIDLDLDGTSIEDDYVPGDHTQAEVEAYVADYPDQLGVVLVSEAAGSARVGTLTALQTAAKAVITRTPASGAAAGGTAVSITGTATNVDAALAVVTAVKFATTNGTSFSWNSGTGTLAATSPAHAAGAVNLTLVGFPGGDLVLTTQFTYT